MSSNVQPALAVADVQQTLDYYRDTLGFTINMVTTMTGGNPINSIIVSRPYAV